MPPAYSADVSRLEKSAGIFAVGCLVISALLLGNPTFSNASLPIDGITDPVIAIQAARSVKDVDYVLGEAPSQDREVMRVKERIGFGFTAAYTGLFLALSMLLLRSGTIGRILAPAAMVTSLAAGGFNVASNLAVLRLLDAHLYETTAPMISAIRSAAFVSWSAASITLLLLSVYFLRTPKILARLTGVLFVITAVMQLIGLRDGEFLVLASAPAGVALVLIAVMMLLLPRLRRRRPPPAALLLALLLAGTLRAEVKEIRTYNTHEPRDRYVIFAMAVTQQGDVLSLVPKKDGKWRLTRIQNWTGKKPADQTVELPGPAVVANTLLVSPEVLATHDGRFIIGIGSDFGTQGTFVSVVDPESFEVLKTGRQPGGAEHYTDAMNRLIAANADYGGTPIAPGHGSRTNTFRFFTLPGLMEAGSCQFRESLRGRVWLPVEQDCGPSLPQVPASLDPRWPNELPGVPCSPAGHSADGLYQLESCSTGVPGSRSREAFVNIYSVKAQAPIGRIDLTLRDTVQTRFASLNGRDYVLVMEGGTKLKVYEISGARH